MYSPQADGDGDVTGDCSFASVGTEDGKGGPGPGKLTLKLLLDNGLIEVMGIMCISPILSKKLKNKDEIKVYNI